MYLFALALTALLGLTFYVVYPPTRVGSCISPNPQYRFYAGQTTLEEATNGSLGGIGWQPPQYGYTPYKFIMLSKHGARHFDLDQQLQIANTLLDLRFLLNNGSSPGYLCQEDWEYLESWTPLVEPSNSLKLAYEGWLASRDLGQRYRQRYPDVFLSEESSSFEFVHNDMSDRGNASVDTAKAFLTGVFGSHVGVSITNPRQPDTLLEFYRNCEKYNETVPPIPDEYAAFIKGLWMQSVLRTMEIRMGLYPGELTHDDALTMYDSCRSEYSIRHGNAPWCVMFREEDAEVMEYAIDLFDYYRHGYGYDINHEQSCNLFSALVERILERSPTPYSVHAWWMEPEAFDSLVARLGLWAGDPPLTADSYQDNKDREWRSSRHAASGSNLVFVVQDADLPNSSIASDIRIQAFHNEHLIQLPICQTTECTEDEIRAGWEYEANQCDFDQLCSILIAKE